ncbi:hypothetical protein I4U23_010440 [Adineta vaga]|nr:hypothetical protein I4U23_010440 [Adineta vaga]
MNMEYSTVEFNDLSDEILLIIFKNLDNFDVLYSLHNVNKRFNRIMRDPIFASSLNFVKWSPRKFLSKFSSDVTLNRFRLQILPDISPKIKWFHLDASSAKRVLLAADYPNLYGLGLYNIKEKTARRLFIDTRLSSGVFKNQITTLIITMNERKNDNLLASMKICTRVFSVFINLTYFKLTESSCEDIFRLMSSFPIWRFSSSNLIVLNIKVQSLSQFVYLLDGRFSQLQTLVVDVVNTVFVRSLLLSNDKLKTTNLKCFVLSCGWEMSSFEEFFLPIIYGMTNLEELGLYVTTYVDNGFIDENYLKKNLLNRMSQLNIFQFDIRSLIITNQMDLPLNKDIDKTFIDVHSRKTISYFDFFPVRKLAQYHFYSYPSETPYYLNITNHFPGGLFEYVRKISLYDERPFEHNFLVQVSRSLPFVQHLSLTNHQQQKREESYNSSIAKYNHLIFLDIEDAHDDYVEEFLSSTNTYLNGNINLVVNYNSLKRVTSNFTRDNMRLNCSKIEHICILDKPNNLNLDLIRDYFPFAFTR